MLSAVSRFTMTSTTTQHPAIARFRHYTARRSRAHLRTVRTPSYWYARLSRTLIRVAPRAGKKLAITASTVMATSQKIAPRGV
jgi:hypothetical protein